MLNQMQVSDKIRLILTLNTGEVIERDVEEYDYEIKTMNSAVHSSMLCLLATPVITGTVSVSKS